MRSPFVPIALFAFLITTLVATVPLSAAGSGFAVVALAGFVVTLAGLAWWVICIDREADPRAHMERAADRFDKGWGKFERDFWAYVDAVETEAR